MAFRLVKPEKGKKVNIIVSISNKDHNIFFSDTIRLPVGRRLEPKEARDSRVPPDFDVVKAPPLRTSAGKVTLEVKASDDESIKDLYAYVGEKKIYYSRSRGKSGNLPVRMEVPLEPGSNRVTLFARDQKNLVTAKTYFVHRTETDEGQKVGMQ